MTFHRNEPFANYHPSSHRNRSRRLLTLTMTRQLARNSGPLLDIVQVHALESASLKIHTAVGFIRLGHLPFSPCACIIDRAELICDINVLISKASTGAR